MLHVAEYLLTHTFAELETDHGICSRMSRTFDKVTLNYDTILASPGDVYANQCRGLVIRPVLPFSGEDGWKDRVVGPINILARPMDRFFNHGDSNAAQVNWDDPELRVFEKLDGTMIVTYWDPMRQRWFTGTRSVPEADLPIRPDDINIGMMTFSDLFMLGLRNAFHRPDLTRELFGDELGWDRTITYVFELTSPINRVVVRYDVTIVTLVAARTTITGKEWPVDSLGMPFPSFYDLRDPAALEAFINTNDPSKFEGCVVVDSEFRRQKMKSMAWVLSSRAKDLVSVSRRAALGAAIDGTLDDVIPLVEESIAKDLTDLCDRARSYLLNVDAQYQALKTLSKGDRKEFALLVQGQKHTPQAILFGLYTGKGQTAAEVVRNRKGGTNLLDALLEKLGYTH